VLEQFREARFFLAGEQEKAADVTIELDPTTAQT